jgi:hypothetical protein
MFTLLKKQGYAGVAFGIDSIGNPLMMARAYAEFTNCARWFRNFEIL